MEMQNQLSDSTRESRERVLLKRVADHNHENSRFHLNNNLSNSRYNIRVDDNNKSNSSMTSERKNQHHNSTKHGTTKFPDIALRPGHAVEHTSNSSSSNSSNDLGQIGTKAKHQPSTGTTKRNVIDKENYSKRTGQTTNHLTVKAHYDSSHKDTINKSSNHFQENDFEKANDKVNATKGRSKEDTNTNRNRQSKLKQNFPKVKPVGGSSPQDDNKHGREVKATGKHGTEKRRFHLGPPTRQKLELCEFVNRDIIGGDEICLLRFGPTKSEFVYKCVHTLRCIFFLI